MLRGVRDLYRRAMAEHSTPREVGLSVATGIFCGYTPFLGLHMWMAMGLATAFRLNRLWAFLGSRTSPLVLFVWVSFWEIETGHRLRTGEWAGLTPADVLSQAPDLTKLGTWSAGAFGRFGSLFGDWLIGTLMVAPLLAAAGGLLAYAVARWRRARRAAVADASGTPGVTGRTLDELPPRSSGSPPSAPLDQIP
jgi:uncharacterized protein (DUF2062 family)